MMDFNQDESMRAVEYLLEEFFLSSTSNLRKHEIEQQLNSFKNSPQLWDLLLYFITHTTSQYVHMFALSMLDSVINQHWSDTFWLHKEDLRTLLYSFLVEKGSSSQHFLRCKYVKLLVDIAKQEWPEHYPNFFTDILELLRSEHNQLVGLILVRTASEELMGIHANFDEKRKSEVTKLMNEHIPLVFEAIDHILLGIATKPRHTATATPPPSPTHPTSLPQTPQQLDVAFRPDTKALTREALNTLQNLFSWVQISQIPSDVIRVIFNFMNISSYAQEDDDMCVLAISTVNELLYRRYNPPGSEGFFHQIYLHVIELMKEIISSSTHCTDTLDFVFVEKLSELLILLIENHFRQFHSETNFSGLDFLTLLYSLTMQIHSIQCYLQCINVWMTLIKQEKGVNVHRYSSVFSGLVNDLLKKIQFTYNGNQLKDINTNNLDDDNESNWQIFLRHSIELISLIAEFAPLEIYENIFTLWKSSSEIYRQIESIVDHQNSHLNCEPSQKERLYYVLRDFSTLTQTLATISSIFYHQCDDLKLTSAPILDETTNQLIDITTFSARMRFYSLKSEISCFTNSFIDVHGQLLAALKTFLTHTEKLSEEHWQCLLEMTLPYIDYGDNLPTTITCALSHLLATVTNRIYTPQLITSPHVLHFIEMAPKLRYANRETNFVIGNVVMNLLFKYWSQQTSEQNARRCYLIEFYFDNLTNDFRQLSAGSTEDDCRRVIVDLLPFMSSIVDYIRDFPIASKKIFYTAIQTSVEHSLILFPKLVRYPELGNCILTLFLNVLRSLQQQLGVVGTKRAVEVFLDVAVNQRTNLFNVEKLLQILQFVVESPDSFCKSFIPGILQLGIEHAYPYIVGKSEENPDDLLALLELLHSILSLRWQYFWPREAEGVDAATTAQRQQQLYAILNIFGDALTHQDINIFKASLTNLEDLNTKRHIYEKICGSPILHKLLTVLLNTLTNKSHTLLLDDIQVAIYHIAATNFEAFANSFLCQYIEQVDGITVEQRASLLKDFVEHYDKDIPTFVQYLQKFVDDAERHKKCNMPLSVFVN